jgi:hypothetical protein
MFEVSGAPRHLLAGAGQQAQTFLWEFLLFRFSTSPNAGRLTPGLFQ